MHLNPTAYASRYGYTFGPLTGSWMATSKAASPEKFPLYLYEMQFRYNHRDEDLIELFLDYLLKPVTDVL